MQETFNEKIENLVKTASNLGISISTLNISMGEAISTITSLLENQRLQIIEKEYLSALAIAKEMLQDKIDVSVEHITVLTDEISRLDKKINSYETDLKALERFKEKRNNCYLLLTSSYFGLQAVYQNAINEFADQDVRKAILKDVVFTPELNFRKDKLLKQLFEQYVDKRKCKNFSSFKSKFPFDAVDKYCEWLKNNVDKDETYEIFLESSKKEVIETLFEDYLDLTTNVNLKVGDREIPLEQLSLGQKGTVIL